MARWPALARRICLNLALLVVSSQMAPSALAQEVLYKSVPRADRAEPMPLPIVEKSKSSGVPRSQRQMIEFDLRSRLSRTATVDDFDHGIQQTQPGDGDGRSELLSLPKDFSGEILMSDPTVGQLSRHVRIEMDFTDTMGILRTMACSGTLIGPRHVITAAHCLYSWDNPVTGVVINDWADEVRVYPGYDNGEGPVGVARGVSLRSWTGWTQDRDFDSDVGLITLDRPVGAIVGWRAFGYASDWDFFDDGAWFNYAYPGPNPLGPAYDGERMYLHVGDYDYDDGDEIGFDRLSYNGTSGSSATKNSVVYAIRSHFRPDDTVNGQVVSYDTYDTRLDSGKFNTILGWLDADTPSAVDLVALDVERGPGGGLVGTPINDLTFLVHNSSSTAFSGPLYYRVYLSADQNITTSDTYVYDAVTSVSIGANGSRRISVSSAAVAPAVPEGDYFLGVILTNSDGNAANNVTGMDDQEPFSVYCASQEVPILVSPQDDHPCAPTTVALAWGSLGGLVDYEVWFKQTDAITFTTNQTQVTMQNLLPGKDCSWRVRGRTPCGNWSAWSDPFEFTTEGNLDGIQVTYPSQQQVCLGSNVEVSFSSKPQADLYRVQVVEIGGATTYVDGTSTTAMLTGLNPDALYEVRVKARDECLQWGNYGSRVRFSTSAAGAETAVALSPIQDQFTGADVVLSAATTMSSQAWEYEVQTLQGAPVTFAQSGAALQVGPLTEDSYRWRVRMESCTVAGAQWSAWTAWETFRVDTTQPVMATLPTVAPQTLGVWTNQDLANVSWAPATDNCCVQEYWILFDQSATTVPDLAMNNPTVVDSPSVEANLPHGENWFHVVAVDGQGNVSDAMHVGPISIDLAPPTDPVPAGSIPSGEWTNTNAVQVSWAPVTDDGAGLAGYSTAWSNDALMVLDATVDTTQLLDAMDPVPEGTTYFYIRAIDNLGNAGPQVRYDFRVDRTNPMAELFSPSTGQGMASQSQFFVQFAATDNTGSGPALNYEHAYSTDGGLSWYEITQCGRPECGPGGNWGTPGNTFWTVPWVAPGSDVYYRVTAIDNAGNRGEAIQGPFYINTATAVDDAPVAASGLRGNYPNPFNPRTTIRFSLAHDEHVQLNVFDAQGRLVRTLISEPRVGPAHYDVVWDGIDDRGRNVASGVYVYRLQAGEFNATSRMTLLK